MQIHILNGDALTERMQEAGFTDLYVCREAMIDGPLRADIVIAEFEKLKRVPADADIHCWFGNDQVKKLLENIT